MNIVAVLDTCVLYPPFRRHVLLSLAKEEIFAPVWSNVILDELARTIRSKLDVPDKEKYIHRLFEQMSIVFPKALIELDMSVVKPSSNLPDPNDFHVIFCASGSLANHIVTDNLKDFPAHVVHPNIKVVSSGAFLEYLFASEFDDASEAINKIVLSHPKGIQDCKQRFDVWCPFVASYIEQTFISKQYQ